MYTSINCGTVILKLLYFSNLKNANISSKKTMKNNLIKKYVYQVKDI